MKRFEKLNVAYESKEEAKSLGASWDAKNKTWYCEESNTEAIEKFGSKAVFSKLYEVEDEELHVTFTYKFDIYDFQIEDSSISETVEKYFKSHFRNYKKDAGMQAIIEDAKAYESKDDETENGTMRKLNTNNDRQEVISILENYVNETGDSCSDEFLEFIQQLKDEVSYVECEIIANGDTLIDYKVFSGYGDAAITAYYTAGWSDWLLEAGPYLDDDMQIEFYYLISTDNHDTSDLKKNTNEIEKKNFDYNELKSIFEKRAKDGKSLELEIDGVLFQAMYDSEVDGIVSIEHSIKGMAETGQATEGYDSVSNEYKYLEDIYDLANGNIAYDKLLREYTNCTIEVIIDGDYYFY